MHSEWSFGPEVLEGKVCWDRSVDEFFRKDDHRGIVYAPQCS